jgi:C4-dicarboxylate transporter DctM subunit
LPGLIIVIFSAYTFIGRANSFPRPEISKAGFLRMARALKDGMPALGLPAIIFGGVYGGIFTVTESAAVAAGYALFVELVIHRGIELQDLPAIVIDTGVTTSIVLFLCAGAMVLARFLTLEQIPQMWAEQIFGLVKNKWVFILN